MSDVYGLSVRFEVAQDILGAIIAHYAEVLGEERAKDNPDTSVIEKALQAQNEMDDLRDSIDPDDEKMVTGVIDKYGPIARELWGL